MTSSKTLVWRPDIDSPDLTSPHQKVPARVPYPPRRRTGHQNNRPKRRQSHRDLSPELLAQIYAEGYGRAYVQKQIRRKTPMVFELYGAHVEGTITRRLTYAFDVLVDGETRRIEKINIKYMYKRDQIPRIVLGIGADPDLEAKNLVSIARRSERFQIEDSVLARCHKEETPARLTLRGGEIIIGTIDWFSQYEIKINFMHRSGVVVFRHGLYQFEITS